MHAGDETFLRAFEAATWPLDRWHHRQHVKAAYLYLCKYPFDVAMEQMRNGIQAYNAAHQVPDAPSSGYHETMTQAWLRLVNLTLCEFGPRETADEFIDEHTQLLSKRALLFFYSRSRILSPEAKQRFVEPDLAPLPRFTKRHSPSTRRRKRSPSILRPSARS